MTFLGLWAAIAHGIEVPGAEQETPIALVGGTLYTIDSAPQKADLVFDDGRIVAVGADLQIPDDAERIDVTGLRVYPSLIDADSALGLVEIDAVRATRDHSEVGSVNPNVRASIAFNPDSEMIPVTRANGLLLVNSVPRGRFVTGQASLMMLDGWNALDMTVRPNTGLHVRWPRIEAGKKRNERLDELTQLFDDARTYLALRKSADGWKYDARLQAMKPLIDKQVALFASANGLLEIQSAVAFAERQSIRLVIVGGYDAPHCVRLLKKHKVPVVVSGTQRLPRRRNAHYDEPFSVPRRLHEAGVRFCISAGGRFGASNSRNLPYQAGTAAAFGLPADEALRAITLSAARILGVQRRVGSLTVGKDATLFVADGDILETPTQVNMAFVQGRRVSLNNRHRRLYDKFRQKYDRQVD
jgi:imidazolonepropionase-like amidohydrolase